MATENSKTIKCNVNIYIYKLPGLYTCNKIKYVLMKYILETYQKPYLYII